MKRKQEQIKYREIVWFYFLCVPHTNKIQEFARAFSCKLWMSLVTLAAILRFRNIFQVKILWIFDNDVSRASRVFSQQMTYCGPQNRLATIWVDNYLTRECRNNTDGKITICTRWSHGCYFLFIENIMNVVWDNVSVPHNSVGTMCARQSFFSLV